MFVDKYVKIKLTTNNRDRYRELGYQFDDKSKTIEVMVEHLPPYSEIKIKFICDICKGVNQITDESKYKIYAKFKGNSIHCCRDSRCIQAKVGNTIDNKEIPIENSFGYNYPEQAKMWSNKNTKTPYQYSKGSNKKVWWKCDNPNHEDYLATVHTHRYISNGNNGCPYCKGIKICVEDSLGIHFPDLAKMWNKYKNNKTPYDVRIKSNIMAWWICEACGGEWESSVDNMYRSINTKNKGCSWCAGKKVARNRSLGAVYPELLKEWCYDKNDVNPFEIMPNHDKKVNWKCKHCSHEWMASPNKRVGVDKTGCPGCNKTGFSHTKPAKLYVVRWYDDNKEFLKIGITRKKNNSRISQQFSRTHFEYEILKEYHFDSGKECQEMESMLLQSFEFGVISKEEFPDGFTETTDIKNLDSILQLIESNM